MLLLHNKTRRVKPVMRVSMIRGVLRVTAVGVALLAWGQDVMACPPHVRQASPGGMGMPWNLLFLVVLFMGVPALLFRTLAPSPLPAAQDFKLWRLRIWTSVLGAVLVFTSAVKERRAFARRVAEVVRQAIMSDGASQAWKAWASRAPNLFHRVLNVANVGALLAVVGMWTWTVVDPSVTWGKGAEIPVSFLADTVLTYVAARFLLSRVGMHLAQGMMEGDVVTQLGRTLFKSVLLGGAAGWVGGALFGLSSGVQTFAMIPDATVTVVPFLTGWYGIHMCLMGSVLGTFLAGALLWPRRPEPRGLLGS
jgi:hypothetical protein